MTRKEQIKEVAGAYAIDEVKDTCNPASKRGLLYAGFVDGAEWADAHPVVKVGSELKNYERGYEDAIDKVCKWLDYHLTFNVAEWDEGYTTQRVIDKFRKAMKGE